MKKDITRFLTIITMALMIALVVNPVNVQARTIKATKVKANTNSHVVDYCTSYFIPTIKLTKGTNYLYQKQMLVDSTGYVVYDRFYSYEALQSACKDIPQISLGKQYITFKDGFRGGIDGTHYAVMFIPQETGTYQFTCTNRNKNKKVTKNFGDGEMEVFEMTQDENGNFVCKSNGKNFDMKKVLNNKRVGTRISTCGEYNNKKWRFDSKKDTKYTYTLEKGKVYIMSFFSDSSFKRSTKVEIGVKKTKSLDNIKHNYFGE